MKNPHFVGKPESTSNSNHRELKDMQTITTKYHAATETKGARISAVTSGGKLRRYYNYNHELSQTDNHKAAAKALKKILKWSGKMVAGETKTGFVFVFVRSDVFIN